MDTILQLFIENDQKMKKSFKWENHLVRKYGALQLAFHKQAVQIDHVKEMMEYIKKHTSALSYFRGNNLFSLATALTIHSNEVPIFDQTLKYYEDLKRNGFKRSMYLPYVALFLATELQSSNVQTTIDRALTFHQVMKKNHYWLTSDDDYMLATILAHSHSDITKATQEMEECYSYLNKNGINKSNALQTMSHILTLSESSVHEKCDRLLQYETLLKEQKIKLDSYSRSLLAILAILDHHVEEVVNQIVLTDNKLSSYDGFGNWSLGKSSRNMFSVALVSAPYYQNGSQFTLHTTLQNSIQSILLAQQSMMVGTIAATTAATS